MHRGLARADVSRLLPLCPSPGHELPAPVAATRPSLPCAWTGTVLSVVWTRNALPVAWTETFCPAPGFDPFRGLELLCSSPGFDLETVQLLACSLQRAAARSPIRVAWPLHTSRRRIVILVARTPEQLIFSVVYTPNQVNRCCTLTQLSNTNDVSNTPTHLTPVLYLTITVWLTHAINSD